MDDKTKTMMLTLATGAIKKGLLVAGTSAAGHGIIAGNQVETFVSVGMVLVSLAWSFWNDYGKAILISQLEVLKAKSLAQAAKMKDAGVPPVTAAQIAAQSPTLSSVEVVKTVNSMPPAIQATVVKIMLLAFALSFLVASGAAQAQTQTARRNPAAVVQSPDLIQKLKDDFTARTGVKATGDLGNDLLKALDAKMLPDLQYALLLAKATGSNVTAPCWQAWIDMINTQVTAVKNADGTEIDAPDPHLITSFERMVELRNALQPDSKFMTACSPVANLVKQDVIKFMGIVISGGAGLATLVPGL